MGIQVFNVLFQGNQGNGMRYPGKTAPSYLIVGSQFIDNGSQVLVGDSSGGFKSTGFGTVLNSYFANNVGQGVWCDVGCDGGTWTIEGNTVVGNSQGGIRYEISDGGALIKDNIVKDNSGLGGIQIVSSGNATVVGNVAQGNQPGDIDVAASSGRGNRFHQGLGVRENVVIQSNTTGTPVNGCDQSGVTCSGNTTT
jgi:parallel beta-helix repeat protein